MNVFMSPIYVFSVYFLKWKLGATTLKEYKNVALWMLYKTGKKVNFISKYLCKKRRITGSW